MATGKKRATAAGGKATTTGKPFEELGVSGTPIYGGYVSILERNPKAQGAQRYVTASEMLANVSIIAASVRYFLNLVSKAEWKVNPVNDKPEAKAAAEFVESVMTDMATSWARIVRRGGMYRFHGWSWQEWTAKVRKDGKVGFADIESRPQKTILRWGQNDLGKIIGVYQRNPMTGREIPIPRWKSIYLVDDMLTDSPEGMGWFRHLLEPSEGLAQLLKLEVIGFERDLSGIPKGYAPITAINNAVKAKTMTQKQADDALEAMRQFIRLEVRKENTGIMLDSQMFQDQSNDGTKNSGAKMWDLDVITGKSMSLGELHQSIERRQREMARIMGTEGLMIGGDGKGSMALSEDKSDQLSLHVNSTLGDVAEFMTRDIIDPIWILNGFDDELKPEMATEDVAFRDVQEVTAALRDMATAGAVLAPDDPAIEDVRDLLGISAPLAMTVEQLGALRSAQTGTDPAQVEADRQASADAAKVAADAKAAAGPVNEPANGPPGKKKSPVAKGNPNHDEKGRFASGDGGGGGGIDAAIAGLPKWGGQSATSDDAANPITQIGSGDLQGWWNGGMLPGAQRMLGTPTQETLATSELITPQGWIERGKLSAIARASDLEPVRVLRHEGKNYLFDGNHRAVVAAMRGEKVKAEVYTMPADWPDASAGLVKPEQLREWTRKSARDQSGRD